MLNKFRGRLSYANVMATMAFFLALAGGTAYAANTVFSTDIVNGEVKTPDLQSAGVNTSKLANGAVTTAKLAANSVNSAKVVDNSLKGADIDESTLSVVGATNFVIRSAYIPSGHATVSCAGGEVATGGGVSADVPPLQYVGRSEPAPTTGTPTGWKGWINTRADGNPGSGTVFVVCART